MANSFEAFQKWKKVFSKKLTKVDIENVYGISETVISYVLLKNE